MNTDETSANPLVMAEWLDRALSLWHASRLAFVLLFVLTGFFLFFLWRGRQEHSTRAVSPATQEKQEWLGDKKSVSKETVGANDSNERPILPAASRAPNTRKPNVVVGKKPPLQPRRSNSGSKTRQIRPVVFFSSLTGTTRTLVETVLVEDLTNSAQDPSHIEILPPVVHDLSYIDLDDHFISGPRASIEEEKEKGKGTEYVYLVVVPSYDIDTILTNFLDHLKETHHDFRIDTAPLASLLGYSVFGIGDKEGWPNEEKGFCYQAIEIDKWLAKLTGRKRAYPLGLGDVKGNAKGALREWAQGICSTLIDIGATGTLGEGVLGSGNAVESDDEVEEETEDFPDRGRKKRQKLNNNKTTTVDLEDVGGKAKVQVRAAPLAVDFTTYSSRDGYPTASEVKQMVPKESPTYTALTKQGYTIVGSHSGVKICRWTKSALRGRGSCYKNSFYGIASHLCMETTPSLSCSNKCVFCWRHGTNPVSTTWRWQVDDPQMIFDGAKAGHYKKIKMMRGVPGVRSERFEEAMRIRHCALSLVGEPIFYPHINEFVRLLHSEHISSFLVCNAQHPQQLRDLRRVTQLYVSIDASNRESLRKIDRPLHRDFWERFNECLDILREKRFVQRTVFRLTLVKGFNIDDEAEGYADLVQKGLPCFIEIKGVTYCGTTSAAGAGLTMQNVPFYEEVVQFVTALNGALAKRGLEYGIAAEHAHSCCVLLASRRFFTDDMWHTIIDYERFFELLESGKDFAPEDYTKPTAEWALWGNGGFDPRDERVDRKGRPKN